MTNQLKYLVGYGDMVDAYLKTLPEKEAMEAAVGGNYERFGALEYIVLRQFGLSENQSIVDVGCGSGRLARRLAGVSDIEYLGTDVVDKFISYCSKNFDFRGMKFAIVDRVHIPMADQSADMVAAFSVFTHILPEESYVYLAEAQRVLRPGGRIVFSFLELSVEMAWAVFEQNVEWVRQGTMAGHLNVFLHPDDLELWARKLNLTVSALVRGDEPFIDVTESEACPALPAGKHRFGQSLCVMTKAG